jgi:hypothetical protein
VGDHVGIPGVVLFLQFFVFLTFFLSFVLVA